MKVLTGLNLDHLLIGGEWLSPTNDGRLKIVSPDSEEIIARVAEAGAEDMDLAVAKAREAFDTGPWPRMPVAERVTVIERMTKLLHERQADFAELMNLQVGVVPLMANFMATEGTKHFDRTIELGRSFPFEERAETTFAEAAYVVREPVGVVAAISPWNAPYSSMAAKVAPALLAGCVVIMKPAPETPLDCYIIAECAIKAGVPLGVISLVPADRDASDHLVRNPGVDKVTFTGSTVAGKHIAEICARRMARCTMELGGKSAAIVLDDYPIDAAADTLAQTITMMSGQICAMLTRVIVSKDRHDELADAIAVRMKGVNVGPSTAESTQMGPLAMKRQLERVESYIDRGKAEGATLVTGGGRPAHLNKGYFIEPTLFSNVRSDMTIAQEEIFGPVLSLMPCEDEDDAVRIANDSIYGLSGAVMTTDPKKAMKVARQIRTGNVGQNGLKADFGLPFGGYKQSGVGREGGAEGLSAYLETKTVFLDAAV